MDKSIFSGSVFSQGS